MSFEFKIINRNFWQETISDQLTNEQRAQAIKCADECYELILQGKRINYVVGLMNVLCNTYFREVFSGQKPAVFIQSFTGRFSLERCYCCRQRSMNVPQQNAFPVCHVCGWEEDGEDYYTDIYEDGPKMYRLYDAREKYLNAREQLQRNLKGKTPKHFKRKHKLKNLVYALTDSFNGRNNDIDGYWGLGKLYLAANRMEVGDVTLNLLEPRLHSEPELIAAATQYKEFLRHQYKHSNIPGSWVSEAFVKISFNVPQDHKKPGWGNGDYYVCESTLIGDKGQVYQASTNGYCRPHDPRREQRRHGYE